MCAWCADNDFGDAGGTAIAAALRTNTTVTSLNINGECLCVRPPPPARVCAYMRAWCAGNGLGADGGAAIAAALGTNTTVTSLNL
jgi:hypothetical protein